jgi:hypothetical protein
MDGGRRGHDLGYVQQCAQDALCNELSALIRSDPDFAAADSFQSQSQGARGNLQDHQAFWWLQGRTKRIGGPRILAFHPASEHRTKSVTPIFPPPGASPSILTGK